MQKIDFTKFNGGDKSQQQGMPDRQWWKAPTKDRAQAVAQIIQFLCQYDTKRQTQYQISARLYGNQNIMGINGLSFSKLSSAQSSQKDRVSYNVIQSCTDTVTSKIAKNKPRPMFLTSGGNWIEQRKAKKLEKFNDGIFYENKGHDLCVGAFRDGCIFGDGFLHVYNSYGRVKYERVLATELYTDWLESFYGEPRQLHRVKNVDRQVLIDAFPGKKELIKNANGAAADMVGGYQNVADQVTVVQSWHLRSGPEAKDGLVCITIPEGTLMEREWKRDYFPFARFSWSNRIYGYFAQGLAEQIQNIQLEINKILWVMQRSYHLAGSFKVLLENSAKIVTEHLNNDIGAIIKYNGTKPEYVVPPVVPMEMYQYLQSRITSAFEQAGISQLSAGSKKPDGLNSGKALREYNDIESDRFQIVGQAYEKLHMDLCRIGIDEAREIALEDKDYGVKVPGKKFIQTIKWEDVDLDDDAYVMKMFPVSSLPNEPAGRLATIQEYIQAGFLSPRTGQKLLDFPDLEKVEDLKNAQEEYLNMILEKMVDDGEYTAPEGFDDLQLARELALEYYSQGKLGGLEEEKLQLLRNFIAQIDTVIAKAQPPAPPQAAPGAPQAAPMPAPTSDLIPNVPGAA